MNNTHSRIKRYAPALFLLLLGAALAVAGGISGGYTGALQKAVYICLECVGIG